MIIILSCIIVYILSAYLLWLYTHISHSEGGIHYPRYLPAKEDIVFVFIPLINTIFSIFFWTVKYPVVVKKSIVCKFFKL